MARLHLPPRGRARGLLLAGLSAIALLTVLRHALTSRHSTPVHELPHGQIGWPQHSPVPSASLRSVRAAQRIPRVLHQTWKTHDVPEELQTYVNSWKRHNPEWKFRLWNDTEGRELIREHYPWFYKYYDSFKSGIEKADILRYFILYHYGGVYADLDVECLRPWEPLLQRHDEAFQYVIGAEPHKHAHKQRSRNLLICNAVMISAPRHPFLEAVFNAILDKVPEVQNSGGEWLSPVDTTGPVMLSELYESSPRAYDDVMIYPSTTFYPLPDNHDKYNYADPTSDKFRHSWAVHRWHHLWLAPDSHTDAVHYEQDAGQMTGVTSNNWNGAHDWHSAVKQTRIPAASISNQRRSPLVFITPSVSSHRHAKTLETYATTTTAQSDTPTINLAKVQKIKSILSEREEWYARVSIDSVFIPRHDTEEKQLVPLRELGGLPVSRRGRAELGTSATGTATFLVIFDGDGLPFIPAVIVHLKHQGSGDAKWKDTYAAEVQNIDQAGFTVNVCRLDKLDNTGWGQQLRLDYLAWLPGQQNSSDYREGKVLVGKSPDSSYVQITVNFAVPFAPDVTPSVVCSPQSQIGQEHTDVHSVVLHEKWSGGFNMTVMRVDRLGEGWGGKVHISWIAWRDSS